MWQTIPCTPSCCTELEIHWRRGTISPSIDECCIAIPASKVTSDRCICLHHLPRLPAKRSCLPDSRSTRALCSTRLGPSRIHSRLRHLPLILLQQLIKFKAAIVAPLKWWTIGEFSRYYPDMFHEYARGAGAGSGKGDSTTSPPRRKLFSLMSTCTLCGWYARHLLQSCLYQRCIRQWRKMRQSFPSFFRTLARWITSPSVKIVVREKRWLRNL